ncbi:hypothetical protein ACFE04_022695 [Oxalis oulophora]
MGGNGGGGSGSSSSEEEDGDAEWKASIESITTTTFIPGGNNGFTNNNNNCLESKSTTIGKSIVHNDDYEDTHQPVPQKIKLYQVKAQKLLDGIIEKTLEIVKDPVNVSDNHVSEDNQVGIRLFKNAPVGIVFDHVDEIQGPKKKPKIVPGQEFDEKSKKYKKQIQSVVLETEDIISAAKVACAKSLARLEARDLAAKEKAKKEEERIAELKKVRGERWLPSIAKEMQNSMHLAGNWSPSVLSASLRLPNLIRKPCLS